jgi:threonine dehydrogenase-like Zn-dependent dehydrogenase
MRQAVIHAPGDVRVEERDKPTISAPTDAIIRVTAACVCGSDLWPYRGVEPVGDPHPMGHEYVGIVDEVGAEVVRIKPGQFVVGSFMASDNTCEICQAGYRSRCIHVEYVGAGGAQAEYLRVPLADGTLVATPYLPDEDLIPSLLAASDVLGTGWFGAVAVGTQESMMQAIRSARPGGHVGYVGVAHGVELPGEDLFYAEVHLLGGPAPVRRFLPELIDLIWARQIDPGRVFDLELPLDWAADGYQAMDERRAIKALLRP